MNNSDFSLTNQWWELEVHNKDNENFIYKLHSKINDVLYADQDYHSRIIRSKKRGSRYVYLDHLSLEYKAKDLAERTVQLINKERLLIEGIFRDTEIKIEHEFELKKDSKWLREKITLKNTGKKRVKLGLINLGFKKAFFRQYSGWIDNLDEYKLTAIPTRRFIHYGKDRKKKYFNAQDLLFNAWVYREDDMPGFCSEGWLWGNSEGGLLICKYNLTQLEFSRFKRFASVLPGRGCEDVYLIFGGASLCQNNPELATTLDPGESYQFGISKYCVYEGDYKNGYYLYRSHLDEEGHIPPKNYNPPINWNELYNLGWINEQVGFFKSDSQFELYTLEDLYNEAEIAQDIGAECLYLDPGWNTFMGSEIWNDNRFGSLKEFSKTIHEKYNLKLGLHLMMNIEGLDEREEFYLKNQKGVRVVSDPYINLYCVCTNEKWVQEKSRRILELVKDGVDFLMFDFTDIGNPLEELTGCYSKDHGHEVPMTQQTHAYNIFRVIQNIKKKYPNILIEAHDRGVGNQLYYQHNLPHSFDEKWGFECMWNPMQDLISHKAFQLYEYNLAYSIPLYLHINENSDNEKMLQFWWYASVVTHIGIGGLKDKNSPKYKALQNAITLYKKIKLILTKGIFYGISPTVHLHVDEDSGSGVITAFNLSSRDKNVAIKLDTSKFNLKFQTIEIFTGTNQK
ncbi:MAG: hypothetical protein EU540_08435, partial [Promethearchaeota archaeon]